jgi:glyoxylase-like metal-dependent hydrolase (beta-lactamase superfamily II)
VTSSSSELEVREIGPVRVLFGQGGGRYPDANSLLVCGSQERVIVDPALGLLARPEPPPEVDRVLNSHCHEDHISGNHLFSEVPWHLHRLDQPGIRSLDGMMAIYGLPEEIERPFREVIREQFHFVPRPDALCFEDGDVFDLGGTRLEVIHSPGHTRGHCCFLIEWQNGDGRLLYLGDIDLTGFGPYYGDAWSSLEDFERSMERVGEIDARWYVTAHHIGLLEGREPFRERLQRFGARIREREARLLEYLGEPHSLEEIVEHRFVYRPQDQVVYLDPVERRSMEQHLDRLRARGRIEEIEGGRYRTRS